MFTGTYTAIVTPFNNGKVDDPALDRLIRAQVKGGVDGLVPVGTTGESPSLDYEEHVHVIQRAVEVSRGRVKVLAGTGANSIGEALYLTKAAERVGADGSLQVAPYYNKPTQEGLYQHFKTIARATKLPIILYSIPGRCVIEISVETVKRLARSCRNIVGIKEAGGDADRVSQLRAAMGDDFTVLSGDDALTVPFMSLGADGVISVASNLIPREVSKMVKACAAGKMGEGLRWHRKYYSLFRNLFIETSPGPVKAALAMMGMVKEEYRLPMVPISAAHRKVVRQTLREVGLLK